MRILCLCLMIFFAALSRPVTGAEDLPLLSDIRAALDDAPSTLRMEWRVRVTEHPGSFNVDLANFAAGALSPGTVEPSRLQRDVPEQAVRLEGGGSLLWRGDVIRVEVSCESYGIVDDLIHPGLTRTRATNGSFGWTHAIQHYRDGSPDLHGLELTSGEFSKPFMVVGEVGPWSAGILGFFPDLAFESMLPIGWEELDGSRMLHLRGVEGGMNRELWLDEGPPARIARESKEGGQISTDARFFYGATGILDGAVADVFQNGRLIRTFEIDVHKIERDSVISNAEFALDVPDGTRIIDARSNPFEPVEILLGRDLAADEWMKGAQFP